MKEFTEKKIVEDYFINELARRGWKYISSDILERETYEEPLLLSNLVRALKRHNPGLGDDEARKVVNELKYLSASPEGSKQLLNYLKGGVPVKFEKDRVVKYVKLIDYENPSINEFIVSKQIIHQAGDEQIRNDVILYVNGIPLVNIECKNPASLTEDWRNAYRQIKEYERKIPELYKYVQVGVAAEQTAKYFPVVPWQDDVRTEEWKEPDQDPVDSTIEMLTPTNLLNILQHYLFHRIEQGDATKVLPRYMQYRAAEKITQRTIDHQTGKTNKDRGLIWHWQGSGKTLTMIFAANKIHRAKELDNPTILFIVDREDLQEQLTQEFGALDITQPEVIDSIEQLRQIIRHDDYRGKRGTLILLIQKFRPEELIEIQAELDARSKGQETLATRRNVVAFIDEGHRTQYGTLASQMKLILRNASFYAFTGTPLLKNGRDTYAQFSYPPEEKYLDKYFFLDSINDGFTVKLAYQPRLGEGVRLDKESLEVFLESEFEELPEETRDDVKDRVRDRLNPITVYLENPERIRLVAEDIAQHFKENIDGKYKAMVVAINRKACVQYKRALGDLLPTRYSEIIMTIGPAEKEKVLQEYYHEFTMKNRGKTVEEARRDIVNRFKGEEDPRILIVTDMLLAGFDAPILQTMYLDKPLKEHRLLQAIARTNRPYKGVKEAGLILDYVGIFDNFTQAFETYTAEDITGVITNLDDLRKEFNQLFEQLLAPLSHIDRQGDPRKAILDAIEAVTADEQASKRFVEQYRRLRKLFELLASNPSKIRHLEEYNWLTAVYSYYIKGLRGEYEPDYERYYQKTVEHIHRATELEEIEKNLPRIAFDGEYIKRLQEKVETVQEKAANIVFTLNKYVLTDKHRNPIYESLADKVERILRLWREKVKDYEQILREGAAVFDEINKLEARRTQLEFDELQYSILLTLENRFKSQNTLIDETRELTQKIRSHMYRNWPTQPTARKDVERELRTYLRKYVKTQDLTLADLEALHRRLMEIVEQHGDKH
jgi:type I restriction enzyme R subunit